jgi:hypothetical protein
MVGDWLSTKFVELNLWLRSDNEKDTNHEKDNARGGVVDLGLKQSEKLGGPRRRARDAIETKNHTPDDARYAKGKTKHSVTILASDCLSE